MCVMNVLHLQWVAYTWITFWRGTVSCGHSLACTCRSMLRSEHSIEQFYL